MKTKRREFIRKSLLGTAGLALSDLTVRNSFALTGLQSDGSFKEILPVKYEVEEEIYQHQPADNGSGPMWCTGSTWIS